MSQGRLRWTTLALGMALCVAGVAGGQAPAPDIQKEAEKQAEKQPGAAADKPAADGPHRAEFLLVERAVIEERLKRSAGQNKERQASLKAIFEEAGCRGERLADQPVKHSAVPNLVCKLAGTGERIIIVGAHFDFAGFGKGAADNWTGAALLPSLFQSLNGQPRRHTFIFVGFTDEEVGLVGSQSYAKRMTKQDLARASAMVNMDTLGLSHTRMWTSHSDPKLAQALMRVAKAMALPLGGVNVESVGSTDSESFRKRKVPSITVHSVTQENFAILHTEKDTLEVVRLDDYYDSYRMLAAFLAYLDGTLDPAAARPDPPALPGFPSSTPAKSP